MGQTMLELKDLFVNYGMIDGGYYILWGDTSLWGIVDICGCTDILAAYYDIARNEVWLEVADSENTKAMFVSPNIVTAEVYGKVINSIKKENEN